MPVSVHDDGVWGASAAWRGHGMARSLLAMQDSPPEAGTPRLLLLRLLTPGSNGGPGSKRCGVPFGSRIPGAVAGKQRNSGGWKCGVSCGCVWLMGREAVNSGMSEM